MTFWYFIIIYIDQKLLKFLEDLDSPESFDIFEGKVLHYERVKA